MPRQSIDSEKAPITRRIEKWTTDHKSRAPCIVAMTLRTKDKKWQRKDMGSQEWAPFENRECSAILYLLEGADFRHFKPTEPTVFHAQDQKDMVHRHEDQRFLASFSQSERCEVLYMTWLAAQSQPRETWEAEEKIESGRPWDTSDREDPAKNRLDHTRYRHLTCPYRPYHILQEPQGQGDPIIHAQRQGVAVWLSHRDDKVMGVLLFDPPRKTLIESMHYDFFNKRSSEVRNPTAELMFPSAAPNRESFIARMLHSSPQSWPDDGTGFTQAIKTMMCHWLVEDETKVLDLLSDSIDEIGLSLARQPAKDMPMSLDKWRGFFSRWQSSLYHQGRNLECIKQNATDGVLGGGFLGKGQGGLDALMRQNTELKDRLNGVYTLAMSMMQIVESERSIEEAKLTSRLSRMAFFFVPVSLVTSVFGMGLQVSSALPLKGAKGTHGKSRLADTVIPDQELSDYMSVSSWIYISVLALLFSYGLIYSEEIARQLSQAPKFIKGLDMRRVFWKALHKVFYKPLWEILGLMGFLAGLAVAIWQLVGVHNLPGIALVVGMSGLVVLIIGAWWYLLRRLGR